MQWRRRVPSALALVLPAAVAWVVVPWDGLISRPLEIVDADLVVAYEKIDPAWGHAAVLAVCVVLGVGAGSYAGWRIGAVATWQLDRPFSPWRTATWSLVLFGASGLLAGVAPATLSIRFGKMIPDFYDSDEFDQPQIAARTVLFLVMLAAGAALLLTNRLVVRSVAQRAGAASEEAREADRDGARPGKRGDDA